MSVPINNVPRRVVYAASGTGPYAFTFEILANTDIAVYKDDTLLTLTTDYSVTIAANGTGSITLVTSPVGATQIAIVGNRTIERTTDFVTGGDFFANTVNNELDQQTIFAQQNAEGLARSLQAPQTDPTSIDMTLPRAVDRANKYLAFDSSGNPQPGDTAVEVAAIAAIAAEIATVAGISANVTTVAGVSANVTTVAGISSAVSGVSTISSAVSAVNSNATNINTVAADLAGDDDIGTVAGIAADVTSVAGIAGSVTAVAADATDIGTVATDLAGSNTIGAVAAVAANVTTVAGIAADVTAVAGVDAGDLAAVAGVAADVATVAGISADVAAVENIAANVTTVAGIAANVTTVAGISSAVTGVNTISSAVSAVNSNATNVNTVAGISANVTTVAGNSANIGTVVGISSNITTVAGISSDVTLVAGIAGDLAPVVAIAADIGAVGAISGNVTTVAGISANVTTVANNVADVSNFANVYYGPDTANPTERPNATASQEGDLYFNTTADQMRVFTGAGTGWVAAGSAVNGTSERVVYTATASQTTFAVVYDAGYVDVYQNGVKLVAGTDFTSTSGTDIVLATGATAGDIIDIVAYGAFSLADVYTKSVSDARFQAYDVNLTSFVGTFTLPTTDGTADQLLKTDGSGALSFTTPAPGFTTGKSIAMAMIFGF